MRCMGGAARGSGESVRARCVARCTRTTPQCSSLPAVPIAMADWSLVNREWGPPYDPYQYQCPVENQPQPPQPVQPYPPQAQQYYQLPTSMHLPPPQLQTPPQLPALQYNHGFIPPRDNPREIRNKAEKQRRDKLNHSIAELASMVPPVVASSRKIDKTGVLRLTAHYLRAHQYVFGDSIGQSQSSQDFNTSSTKAILGVLNGFLLTTTYKGLVVVVSQNVHQYLGYTELELLGQNLFSIVHKDDHRLLREQISPKSHMLGPNGELLVPNEPDGKRKIAAALANEKRSFIVRFKKFSQRSEPEQFVTCHVEGSLRKSDRACRGYNRCCQMVRRARARGDNPCSSGNDVVFIGVVRPTSETFINESVLESFRMEYRTRHSIDGEIIQCEQRIAVVTGYMTQEVNGVNAMNFMHRDDVRWVIIALREMYDKHRLFGESCYRLITKNGQFIYMRTRGRLDVDQDSRATSFVCTNTVVEKQEGEHLIKMMKKKFTLMVNNNEEPPPEEEHKDVSENQSLPVEDPRQLEKVILHLVTNLPSPQPEEKPGSDSPDRGKSPPLHIAIIPPRKERIVSAIEKIYSVIKTFQRQPRSNIKEIENMDRGVNINNDKQAVPKPQTTLPPYGLGEPSRRLISNVPLPPPSTARQMVGPMNQIMKYQNISGKRDANIYDNSAGPSSGAIVPVHSGTYAGMASLSFEKPEPKVYDCATEPSTTKIKYHVFIAPQREGEQQKKITELAGGSQSGFNSGIKRPNKFIDPNMTVKKKIVETMPALQEQPNEQNPDRDSPNLAKILDEALSDTQLSQIDSALTSLEQNIDPSFPDLLEVQDLLGEFEEETDLQQRSGT